MLCETFLQPVMYWPKMRIVKARKLGARSKIFLFSKKVQDYGNRLADMSHSHEGSWAGRAFSRYATATISTL